MSNEPRFITTQIGSVLREQGRKQRWLAAKIGIHESIVSEWVSGRRTVDRARAEQIAEILGVPFYLLFSVSKETESVSRAEVA